MKYIDNFLNRITMYKLVLYSLFVWLLVALVLSFFGKLGFAPQALLYSTAILIIVSWVTNSLFSKVFEVPANAESIYITALILTFLISPPSSGQYLTIVPFLIWAAIWGSAAKFIVSFGKKHIFNPAAFAIALTAITLNLNATWWVATAWMLPFILIGGLLITRKVHRFDLVISFTVAAIISIAVTTFGKVGLLQIINQIFIISPLVFFSTVMLTEPQTTPPTHNRRIVYGVITGILFAPNIHLGWLYFTPELALCVGNIASWLMSPKFKYVLTLKSKEKIARDTGEFIFTPNRRISFKPGQYMEWTIAPNHDDLRGNRRYFTIASSPTENDITIGIKFDSKKSSSFKKSLAELEEGKTLMAGQLSGDFTMPKDKATKLCFIAGGIGITPFRSMISYMLSSGDHRDTVLIYSCKRFEELAYTNLIHHANVEFNLKAVSTLSDLDNLPKDWSGYKGFVNVEMFLVEVPDYMDRLFYISGPHSFVEASRKILIELGVPNKQIRTDYFPGF